jgi:hypothetical protein
MPEDEYISFCDIYTDINSERDAIQADSSNLTSCNCKLQLNG